MRLAGRQQYELLWNPELFLVSPVLLSPISLLISSFVCFNSNHRIERNRNFAGTSVFYTANVVKEQGRGRMCCQILDWGSFPCNGYSVGPIGQTSFSRRGNAGLNYLWICEQQWWHGGYQDDPVLVSFVLGYDVG